MKKEIISTIDDFKHGYIIQEVLEQHKDLKQINSELVNTIRVMSFFTFMESSYSFSHFKNGCKCLKGR